VRVSATYGGNYPAPGSSARDAFLMEAVLTLGLVSVVLGTASGAQNLGAIAAVGVAFLLRGRGGGRSGSAAAQGALFTDAERPGQR
jgi:hypothetical protein